MKAALLVALTLLVSSVAGHDIVVDTMSADGLSADAAATEARVVADHVAAHAHHVGPACGTVHSKPPAEHVASLAEFSKRHLSSFQPVTLSVIVHVTWSEEQRAKSYIPYHNVEDAFIMANKVLSGTASQGSQGTGLPVDTGFRLRLHEVKYYEEEDLTDGADGTLSGAILPMEQWQVANAVDPTKYINVWVTDNGVGGGRVDYMPWRTLDGGESNPRWGWIQHWGIFPRDNYGSLGYDVFANYNTGDSLAHEFGHFLNLYHTFNGGCYSITGDYVTDTPAEKEPWRGTCNKNKIKSGNQWRVRNSCTNQAGNDDVSNIMDYSYDNCRDHFTAGQAATMQAAIMRYKPKLYAYSLSTNGGASPASRPVTETPTNSPTAPVVTNVGCTTIGGANRMKDGTRCAFPFRYNGMTYNGCASIAAGIRPYMGKYKRRKPTVKTEDNYWCPTIGKYSKKHKRKRHKWGYCSCAGASADDMLQSSVGSLSDGGDGLGLDEYEGEGAATGGADEGVGSTTEKATSGGASAAVAVLATLCTLMVVGLLGVAVYYRRRLYALRRSDGTYQPTLGPQQTPSVKSQQSFVLEKSGADDTDAALSEI